MANASSYAAVNTLCTPEQATAKVSSVVRAMLLSGSARVSEWPPQTQAARSRQLSGSFAPYFSFISRAQMRRPARYLATSSKKFVYVEKKKLSGGANESAG